MSKRENTKPVLALIAFYTFLVLFIVFVLFGLGAGKDMDNLWLFLFSIVPTILVIGLMIAERYLVGNEWIDSIIHEPEKGILHVIHPIFKDPVFLLLISLIMFSMIGLFSAVTNTFFFMPVEYRVTPAARTIMAAEPASTSETLWFQGLLLPTFMGIIAVYFLKLRSPTLYQRLLLGVLVSFLILAPVEMLYHMVNYGSEEVELVHTYIFGAGASLITVMTGSIIPAIVWHSANNFFFGVKEYFSNDMAIIVAITAIIFFIFLLVLYMNWKMKRSLKNK